MSLNLWHYSAGITCVGHWIWFPGAGLEPRASCTQESMLSTGLHLQPLFAGCSCCFGLFLDSLLKPDSIQYVVQVVLELTIYLILLPKFWGYKHVPVMAKTMKPTPSSPHSCYLIMCPHLSPQKSLHSLEGAMLAWQFAALCCLHEELPGMVLKISKKSMNPGGQICWACPACLKMAPGMVAHSLRCPKALLKSITLWVVIWFPHECYPLTHMHTNTHAHRHTHTNIKDENFQKKPKGGAEY